MRVHDKKKSFKCDACDKVFMRSNNLKLHIDSVHEGRKSFTCDFCKSEFTQNSSLRRHMDRKHGEKKRFKCSTCNASFVEMRSFNEHMCLLFMKEKSHLNVTFVKVPFQLRIH